MNKRIRSYHRAEMVGIIITKDGLERANSAQNDVWPMHDELTANHPYVIMLLITWLLPQSSLQRLPVPILVQRR